MRSTLLTFALVVPAAVSVFGQACPESSETAPITQSIVRTLEGRLVWHDGIRKWFELKLDKPQCGQASVQLVQGERAGTPLEVLRGCQVRSRGALDLSPAGYYSLDVFQEVEEIEPLGKCVLQSPFPDYSKARPNKAIRAYRVDMHVSYEPGDHPIVFRVTSAGKDLQPWQAYAKYLLTGGFVLYGFCGDGFVVNNSFGTPEARLNQFDENMAAFDPESAAAVGKKDLRLGYTCVRNQ